MRCADEIKSMKLGLEGMLKIDAALGFPSKAYPTIHIAGTNGKGSVATKIASALQFAGNKVGLFTSPHISCITERIQINGEQISPSDLKKLSLPGLTFFETVTMAAFRYFAEQKVDIAVIEVGLGGRLDATNIITPILSIITSIDFDHMEYLGNSLEAIAREKAGIIKPGVPYILGPRVPYIEGEKVCCYGSYEEENRAIAERACEILGIAPKGLDITPPCRFQRIGKVILDVAHNPAGLKRVLERIEGPFTALAAFSKNPDPMIELLQSAEELYLTRVEHERVLFPAGKGIIEPDFEKAFARAYACAKTLLVTGTFFMMQNALESIKREMANAR